MLNELTWISYGNETTIGKLNNEPVVTIYMDFYGRYGYIKHTPAQSDIGPVFTSFEQAKDHFFRHYEDNNPTFSFTFTEESHKNLINFMNKWYTLSKTTPKNKTWVYDMDSEEPEETIDWKQVFTDYYNMDCPPNINCEKEDGELIGCPKCWANWVKNNVEEGE